MSSERVRQELGWVAFGGSSIVLVWFDVSRVMPFGAIMWAPAMLAGAWGATEICPGHCGNPPIRPVQKICLVLAYWSLMIAVLGLAEVADRVAHALYELWKFAGFGHAKLDGISLGAMGTFVFLTFCLLATGVCVLLARRAKDWNNKLLYRFATMASTVYVVNVTLVVLLLSSGLLSSIGLAYLDWGR